ncbi:hypothetical protein TIFTF001_035736 [Ficus carica]|uniref:Ubiquitin-like protease family profile domain-containing protein n=1 Tax=Ficus carica TaxID=3494 RepID=A0AA88E644_FICCA|nr:hypothetical protein TIFTF001_035736 [Ficus carica]
MNKKLEDLKKGQKKSTKLLRRVLKLLSDNMNEKGQEKAHMAYHVSNRQKINVQTDESDALKTTSNDIGTGSQDDVFIDSDIGAVADMGKEEEKDDKESIREQEVIKLEEAANEKSIGDMYIDVAFYYLRKNIRQFPELEQRKATTIDTFFSTKVGALWRVYQNSPDMFNWVSCESIHKIMLGVCVQSGSSWFEVNTLLIPIHLADLKYWALIKLDLTNWTIEVYDSLQHEGLHNFKVLEGVECMSKFIPLLANKLSLFEFKPREHPRIYPILVTIMKDIPQQANELVQEWLTCYLWCHAKRKLEQTYKSDDDEDMDF